MNNNVSAQEMEKNHVRLVIGKRGSTRLSVALLLVAVLLLASISGPALGLSRINKIAEVGDQAPGFADGIVFEAFGTAPEIKELYGIDEPARPHIDGQGNIAFHAFVGDDGIAGANEPPFGIFKSVAGELSLIARDGDLAPGTAGAFQAFPNTILPQDPEIAGGRATFRATTTTGDDGLWSERFGSLELVVRKGDSLPGMAAGASLGNFSTQTSGQAIFFSGAINNSGSADSKPKGLWRDVDGQPEVIVITELPAPDLRQGIVFGQSSTIVRDGPFSEFAIDGDNHVAIVGYVKGHRVDTDDDEGIWVEGDNGLRLILREGERTPFRVAGSRARFQGNSQPTFKLLNLNDAGALAFSAEVKPTRGARMSTIWTTRDGQLELIVRGSQKFVAGSIPGDPAPGTDSTFLFFTSLDLGQQGDVLVSGVVDVSNDPFNPQLAGLWIDSGQGLELVAVEGGPVPGLPGKTFVRSDLSRGVGPALLEDDGSVVFAGRYRDDDGRVIEALFRQDPNGSSQIILKAGDEVDVGGNGTDLRAVSALVCHLDGGTSDAGEKACELQFDDGSTGIFSVPVLTAS